MTWCASSGPSVTPLKSCGCSPLPWRQPPTRPWVPWATTLPWRSCPKRSQLLFNYFKQLFAQVTNPPLDAIREELVTSLEAFVGRERNLFEETPLHCHQLKLKSPIITDEELARIRSVKVGDVRATTLSTLFSAQGEGSLKEGLDRLCSEASRAIEDGYSIIVLSDRGVDADHAPIPSLLATSAVHHHLIREGTRTRAGLVVESGEPREVHHFCLLLGYGAGAINPYVALATTQDLADRGELNGANPDYAVKNFVKANEKGLLKVMSKMGISTVQSYRGAQIFECVGLNQEFIDQYFTWTPSRVEGVGLDVVEEEQLERHRFAFPEHEVDATLELDPGGAYQWRRHGEVHQWNPETISKLQYATRANSWQSYQEFSRAVNDQSKQLATLRGLLEFRQGRTPVSLDDVEPAKGNSESGSQRARPPLAPSARKPTRPWPSP